MHETKTQTDEVLLAAWLDDQDQAAFESIVNRYASMVYGTCLRSSHGNIEIAEEASQATFIILARKAQHIQNAQSLPAWLHRCAFNCVKMAHRRQKIEKSRRLELMELTSCALETNTFDGDQWQSIRPLLDSGINVLTKKVRSSIILHYFNGLSIEEIAQRTSSSESAIKKRLHDGRNQLRSFFKRAGYSTSLAFLSTAMQAEELPYCSTHFLESCYQMSAPAPLSGSTSLATGVINNMSTITFLKSICSAILLSSMCGAYVYFTQSATESEVKSVAQEKAAVHTEKKYEMVLDKEPLALQQEGELVIGSVVAVRKIDSMVMIRPMKNENVKINDILIIYRNNEYLGMVVVKKVWGDLCAADLVKGSLNKGGKTFQLGDSVHPQLVEGEEISAG